jgi:N,N'-diacetylchitobiose transport system permease protein
MIPVAAPFISPCRGWKAFTLAAVVMTRRPSQFTDLDRGTDRGAVMAGPTQLAIAVVLFFLLVQGRRVAGLTAGAVQG